MSQLDKTFYEKIKKFTLSLQLVNQEMSFDPDSVETSSLIEYLKRLEEILYRHITSTMTGKMSNEDRSYLDERDRIDIMSMCEVLYEMYDFYCEDCDWCESRLESEMN